MKREMLVEKEKYLENGVHIGTSSKTNDMKRFIYKTMPNGLTVLNLSTLDERIGVAADFLARHKNILVVGRKVNKPIEIFTKITGARSITGRFMPGSLTNPSFRNFFEPDVVVITDPFIDKQVLKEALDIRIPVVAFCNTFNQTAYIDLVVPCNNKGKKSLAMVFFLLSREIQKARKEIEKNEDFKYKIEDFIESRERSKRTETPRASERRE
jgi:small subunit ribosomal protein S2